MITSIEVHPVNTSHSEINAWRECRLSWWFKYCASIQPKTMKPAITIGGIVHGALQHYYFEKGPRTMPQMHSAYSSSIKSRPEYADEEHTNDLLESWDICKRYHEFWNSGDRVDIDPFATEVRFTVPIFWTTAEGIPLFAGQIHGVFDAVFNRKGKIWIGEHKVRGQISPKNLDMDEQIGIYNLVGVKYYGEQFGGICMNLIRRKPAKTRPNFIRVYMSRERHQLATTERNLALTLSQMARANPTEISASYSSRRCPMCFYLDLCRIHKSGKDMGPTLTQLFVKKAHEDAAEDSDVATEDNESSYE